MVLNYGVIISPTMRMCCESALKFVAGEISILWHKICT